MIVTTSASSAERRAELVGAACRSWWCRPARTASTSARRCEALFGDGIRSVLVEGGARVITSFLSLGLADRLVVGIAPRVLGSGTEAVSDLGITEVASSIRIEHRAVHVVGDDVLIAGDLAR